MNLYDVWIDCDKKCHLIEDMETSYIMACISSIKKVSDSFKLISYSELAEKDLKDMNTPLYKAWFVVHARSYLESFQTELVIRDEDTSMVDKLIEILNE